MAFQHRARGQKPDQVARRGLQRDPMTDPVHVIGDIAPDAAAGDDFVEITVSDSGPGFPPDLLANPFLPFSSTKAEGLGCGADAACEGRLELCVVRHAQYADEISLIDGKFTPLTIIDLRLR